MAILDVNSLGVRKNRIIKYVHETGFTTTEGSSQMVEKIVEETETQPILNEEEALLLVDADWQESPEHFKPYGNWYCKVQGRRFFAANKPELPKAQSGKGKKTAKDEADSPVPKGGTE